MFRFDDELMQRFAGEKLQSFSNYLDDDMAIENKMVSKAIENAQNVLKVKTLIHVNIFLNMMML
mgnify:CR=1 FL=1